MTDEELQPSPQLTTSVITALFPFWQLPMTSDATQILSSPIAPPHPDCLHFSVETIFILTHWRVLGWLPSIKKDSTVNETCIYLLGYQSVTSLMTNFYWDINLVSIMDTTISQSFVKIRWTTKIFYY